jgi:hypothetical protein
MVAEVVSVSMGVAERSGVTLLLLMQQGLPPPVVVHGTFTSTIYYGINYLFIIYYALVGWYECLEGGGTS